MKKLLILIFLIFATAVSNDYLAQSGGKKRERHNQRRASRIFKRSKSAGNSDRFASGAGRRGFFARLFKKQSPAWAYHSSGSLKSHRRENRRLFQRHRTKGAQTNAQVQRRQNEERARRRVRGNRVFSKKKY